MLSTVAVVALTIDFSWYEFGRRRGARVLKVVCWLSREPDSCVGRAHNVFVCYDAGAMLVAKFVPGLTTILPPLAGVFAVGRIRFALYELGGVWLWAGLWIGVGYVFSDTVALIATRVATLELWLVVGIAALLGAYILGKYLRRRLYVTLGDLRTPLDGVSEPQAIPGSPGVESEHIDR